MKFKHRNFQIENLKFQKKIEKKKKKIDNLATNLSIPTTNLHKIIEKKKKNVQL